MPSIYIAGKIRNDRHTFRPLDISVPNFEEYAGKTPVYLDGFFDYSGPFAIGCDHSCYHGRSTHGAGANKENPGCGSGFSKIESEEVLQTCTTQIRNSDIFLAWIDSTDCYGTLAELGFAFSGSFNNRPQRVYVAFDRKLRDVYKDFWFVSSMSHRDLSLCTSVEEALEKIKFDWEKIYK